MPTFDFANIFRKLLAAAVSVVASPVTAVLAAAALIAPFFEDIITFFNDDFSLPQIDFPEIVVPYDGSPFYQMLLYAVNSEMAIDFLNTIINWVKAALNFGIEFFVSLISVLCLVGIYKVVRRQLKDTVG